MSRNMFEKRTEWKGKRFGDINRLGKIKNVSEIIWSDIRREYITNNVTLSYELIDTKQWASRIAEIFRNGADESIGNSDREWHCDMDSILDKHHTGNWNFYGCYINKELVSVVSMCVFRGQRAIQWVLGAVDPPYRGMGVWHHMGEYLDEVCRLSNAQAGFAWAVTTHPYSQMSLESAGYIPMGFFPGWGFYGGSDGCYYRTNAILYGKVYDDSCVQEKESMKLTEKARKVVEVVC